MTVLSQMSTQSALCRLDSFCSSKALMEASLTQADVFAE